MGITPIQIVWLMLIISSITILGMFLIDWKFTDKD